MSGVAAPPRHAVGGVNRLVREIARGGLAGLITGIVLGGGGGRLAMRVSALIDPDARGRITEAGATVGEFTLGGTIGLVLFGGIFTGLALALLWVIVRSLLPSRPLFRYATAAAIGVAMGGRFAVDGRNIDFLILDPKAAQVGLFVLLAAVTGAAVVWVDALLERRLPPAEGRAMWWYGVVFLSGLLLAFPSILLMFSADNCACASPPRLPGLLLLAAGAISVSLCSLR